MASLHTNVTDPRSLLQNISLSEGFLVVLDLDSLARQGCEGPFQFLAHEREESSFEAEIGSIHPLNPAEAYDDEIKSKAQHIRDTDSSYANRIEVLREQAELDGYSLNLASEEAFYEFFQKNPLIRRGRLVLMENGNLRAVWKGENEAHIGLQFINNLSVQYVIFTRRDPQSPVSRVSGRDTMDGIKKQIEAFDLNSVLYI